ncbi:MAG: hypothetical protein ACK47B_03235 [Armatimonadota bacterium]
MNALRQNRLRTAVMLLLVMVFSMAGMPAFAACAGMPATGAPAAAAAQPKEAGCHEMGEKPCCCGPSQSTDAESPSLGSGSCGCELQAPLAPAPAEPKTLSTVSVVAAVTPPVVFALTAPAERAALFPDDSGIPRDACRASSPSRAPPASER